VQVSQYLHSKETKETSASNDVPRKWLFSSDPHSSKFNKLKCSTVNSIGNVSNDATYARCFASSNSRQKKVSDPLIFEKFVTNKNISIKRNSKKLDLTLESDYRKSMNAN